MKVGQVHSTGHHSKYTHYFFNKHHRQLYTPLQTDSIHILDQTLLSCTIWIHEAPHFSIASLIWPSLLFLICWCHFFFGSSARLPVPTKGCPCCIPVPTKRCPCCLPVPTKRCPCLLLQGTAAVGWQPSRPHTCSQCCKRFVSLNGLRLHEDLHKCRYRYTCSYCGKGFSGSTNLRGHPVTHTGIKEFRCKLCEREFRYARQLRQHIVVQHAVVMPSNVT